MEFFIHPCKVPETILVFPYRFSESLEFISSDENSYKFYPREWTVFDCRLKNNNLTNVTLLHTMYTDVENVRVPDGKKIKLLSNQIFNLTNLTESDEGYYHCLACGEKFYKGIVEILSCKYKDNKMFLKKV